jgi:hypothetical protein
MIPNFTFLDASFLVTASNGTRVRSARDFASQIATFIAGRYGEASGWDEDANFLLSLTDGSHTVGIVSGSQGTITESVAYGASFQNGDNFFALISAGTIQENIASVASFGTGDHFLTAFISDAGTEAVSYESTFESGQHALIVPDTNVLSDDAAVQTTILDGSLYDALPETDPLYLKAIVQFTISGSQTVGSLDFATVGALNGYTFSYLDQSYVIVSASNGAITFDTPFLGTSFDDRFAAICDAVVMPPPPPNITDPSLIVDNASGTGTFADAPGLRDAFANVSFGTGVYAQIVVFGSMPQDTTPMFATFLTGAHSFVTVAGTTPVESGTIATTFQAGSYTLIVKTAGSVEAVNFGASFQTGVHVIPGQYPTADTTTTTADTTLRTADNVKPFSFDGTTYGYGPTFDEAVVFNFSQE